MVSYLTYYLPQLGKFDQLCGRVGTSVEGMRKWQEVRGNGKSPPPEQNSTPPPTSSLKIERYIIEKESSPDHDGREDACSAQNSEG